MYSYRKVGPGSFEVIDPRGDHYATMATETLAALVVQRANALSSGGAFVPLAVALVPLIPPLVSSIMTVIDAVRADPMTPAEAKVILDDLSGQLDAAVERLKNVALPGDPTP